MKCRETYHRLPRAAHRLDIQAALQHAKIPVHTVDADGLPALVSEILASTQP
jgi:hypothetical protein